MERSCQSKAIWALEITQQYSGAYYMVSFGSIWYYSLCMVLIDILILHVVYMLYGIILEGSNCLALAGVPLHERLRLCRALKASIELCVAYNQ